MRSSLHPLRLFPSASPRLRARLPAAGALAVALGALIMVAAEDPGRQIYLEGTSPSGQAITALLNNTEIPAAVLPCVNCHGRDGRGRPEGGVTPSDISWNALTRPYGFALPSGRQAKPYTERLFRRAVTMGIDSAGNELDPAMPRYRMSRQDIEALTDYVRRLGDIAQPGVGEETVRLGVLFPPGEHLAELRSVLRLLLEAYFQDLNTRGGIYSRNLELHFAVLTESNPSGRAQAVAEFIDENDLFALLASFTAQADAEIAARLKRMKTPLVGAFAQHPTVDEPPNPYVFYLESGLRQQAEALAVFALRRVGGASAPALVISSGDPLQRAAVEAVSRRLQQAEWPPAIRLALPEAAFDPAKAAASVCRQRFEAVFFLGPSGRLPDLLRAMACHPDVYAPSSITDPSLYRGARELRGRLFVAWPTSPANHKAEAVAEYRRIAEEHSIPARYRAAQFSALAAAKVLVEGLRRTGRELTREKLVEELEGFYRFRTGLSPDLTFTPNRRIGASGAYIVSLDLATGQVEPAAPWIEIEP